MPKDDYRKGPYFLMGQFFVEAFFLAGPIGLMFAVGVNVGFGIAIGVIVYATYAAGCMHGGIVTLEDLKKPKKPGQGEWGESDAE